MKKILFLIFTVILAFSFLTCKEEGSAGNNNVVNNNAGNNNNTENNNAGNNNSESGTKLTITNNSDVVLSNISWNGNNFGSLNKGGIKALDVGSGTGFIYFDYHIEFQSYNEQYQLELITLNFPAKTLQSMEITDEAKSFNFLNTTIVVGDDEVSRTLIEFVSHYVDNSKRGL